MKATAVVMALALSVSGMAAQRLADLMAAVTPLGEVLAFANDYVRIHYEAFEYSRGRPPVAGERPAVLFVRVMPRPGVVNTELLIPPRGTRLAPRAEVEPRGVRIELLKPPPGPPALGVPGTDPPRGAHEENRWDGGRLVRATFRPLDYGVGTGPYVSVTVFLSDGLVEVWNRGLRRWMGVAAGDAVWFEAATRLTVVGDDPVGAAIVQLWPRR